MTAISHLQPMTGGVKKKKQERQKSTHKKSPARKKSLVRKKSPARKSRLDQMLEPKKEPEPQPVHPLSWLINLKDKVREQKPAESV